MPLYEFKVDFTMKPSGVMLPPGPGQDPPATRQLSHAQGGRTNILTGRKTTAPGDVEDFLEPGFRSLDAAMKMYWSGIRVPTRDSYRFMRVKIAGGDKSMMIWRDELMNGRTRLPVGALSRTKFDFLKERFSPPYMPMVIKYPSRRGDRASLVYRPTPWLVDYTLTVWAERKRDADYILFQVLTRFNPLAVFRMYDGHLRGDVTVRFGGAVDQSDKEAAFDQHPLVKHEFTFSAEAWLPLPERLIPTVLGHMTSVKDRLGDVLMYAMGRPPI